MEMRTSIYALGGVIVLAACTMKEKAPAPDSSAAPAQSAAPAAPAEADPDRNAGGGGIPSGFVARTDKAGTDISGAKYSASGNDWDVTTGPAHIVYNPTTVGNGNYTASATFEQLEKPAHPEAYGIFIGGRDLDKPTQAYTYFIVRGTGELAVKARDGDAARDVLKWTASPDVPKQDASGHAKYELAAQVTDAGVKFLVNGKQVASLSQAGLPTQGIAGLRINHNLHLKVTPVAIKTP
jgi:hypothetical protein